MAIQFPTSPTVGQIFTSGGFSWRWDGTRWVSVGSLYVSNPNKLLNPFLEIDQANEGAAVNLTSGNLFISDGYHGQLSTSAGGVASGGRSSTGGPVGNPYHLFYNMTTGATSVAAGDNANITQIIEADDIYDTRFGTAQAQTITISFWAYCTLVGTYYLSLRNGVNSRSYLAPFTINTASTWQLITVTVPGDTAGAWTISGNAGGLVIAWSLAAGTTYQGAAGSWQSGLLLGATGMVNTFMTTAGAQFWLGPCKLEVGAQATPMLRTSFQQELSRCQRYYEKSYNSGVVPGTAVSGGSGGQGICFQGQPSANGYAIQVFYKVSKRVAPTVTTYTYTGASGQISVISGGSWASVAPSAVQSTTNNGHNVFVGATTYTGIAWDFVADARL